MASIYELKPAFQGLLRPLTRSAGRRRRDRERRHRCSRRSCRSRPGPRSRGRAGPVGTLLLLPAVLFVRMALNAVDGMLAREHGQKSRLGRAAQRARRRRLGRRALPAARAASRASRPALVAVIVVLAGAQRDAGVLRPDDRRDAAATTGRWGRATAPSCSGCSRCCSALGVPPGAVARRGPGRARRAADRRPSGTAARRALREAGANERGCSSAMPAGSACSTCSLGVHRPARASSTILGRRCSHGSGPTRTSASCTRASARGG